MSQIRKKKKKTTDLHRFSHPTRNTPTSQLVCSPHHDPSSPGNLCPTPDAALSDPRLLDLIIQQDWIFRHHGESRRTRHGKVTGRNCLPTNYLLTFPMYELIDNPILLLSVPCFFPHGVGVERRERPDGVCTLQPLLLYGWRNNGCQVPRYAASAGSGSEADVVRKQVTFLADPEGSF
ncbi:hypothetical protein DM02DRAFT_233553 [Periconia macrospinosa]|uniref:Uncharacterized protein n=1 Tax=Periconia macrospinosa TaxID=97972 RepID=A0A2V1EB45_9PLEO|nr:hypothetical protein DM02DRAFT_233553 [Periconia macrospinosa]